MAQADTSGAAQRGRSEAGIRPPAPRHVSDTLARRVVCVLGVPVDLVTLSEVAHQIRQAVAGRHRLFISTPNLNFLALSRRSPAFRRSLWESDLCTADGIAVVAVCSLAGAGVPERVAGSDFLNALSASGRGEGLNPITVSFFGGAEETARVACDKVNGDGWRNLRCAGCLNPGFGSVAEMSSDELLRATNAQEQDFLIVALGAEKGQAWIMSNRHKIHASVVSHLGATVNFLAGSVRRAPPWVRNLQLEWLWRIYEEPSLARRYGRDAAMLAAALFCNIIPFVAWRLWSSWRYGRRLKITLAPGVASTTLHLMGAATVDDINQLRTSFAEALERRLPLQVDLRELFWGDVHFMGTLLMLSKAGLDLNVGVEFIQPSKNLARGFALNGLADLPGLSKHHAAHR